MSILVCIAIPGKKVCIKYEDADVRITLNTQVGEVKKKPRCDEKLRQCYRRDFFFSERRRQQLKTLHVKPTRKLNIVEIYQLVVNSLEKHI